MAVKDGQCDRSGQEPTKQECRASYSSDKHVVVLVAKLRNPTVDNKHPTALAD